MPLTTLALCAPPRRRRRRVALLAGLLAAALGTFGTGAAAAPAASAPALARVSDTLADQLAGARALVPLPVMVHGTDVTTARSAARSSGMTVLTSFDTIGVVVAAGTPAQVQSVRSRAGVTYVEGNQPIAFSLATSGQATRGDEAQAAGVAGTPLDGRGVSVAIIDSGVDGTHPFFQGAGGSAVVRNLKGLCAFGTLIPIPASSCFADLTLLNDTDTLSAGGHGTHVAGIVAGRPVTTTGTAPHQLDGAAPGASIVALSVGAGLNILGADSALNWVLENHAAPCGAGVSAAACPPIKVTNNSYGP
ncbi:MAG TPA: S8 family serine peptidase, partial [Iamia sp.]|nr:S8 family serine peptidase [Iamia sp.]